jgi:hypothetical protein
LDQNTHDKRTVRVDRAWRKGKPLKV